MRWCHNGEQRVKPSASKNKAHLLTKCEIGIIITRTKEIFYSSTKYFMLLASNDNIKWNLSKFLKQIFLKVWTVTVGQLKEALAAGSECQTSNLAWIQLLRMSLYPSFFCICFINASNICFSKFWPINEPTFSLCKMKKLKNNKKII